MTFHKPYMILTVNLIREMSYTDFKNQSIFKVQRGVYHDIK
jgi:hypothetical protein